MADGKNCRVWDGVALQGWQVWSDITQEDNDVVFMENSTIYARSPENVIYTLGKSKSTRTFTCGSDIYIIYRVDEYDDRLLFTPPSCTDNTITVGYDDKDDNGTLAHPHKEWFPARP